MTITIESVAQIYKGWSTLSKATIIDGGTRYTREVEDHGQAVAVLPFDPVRRVALLIQTPRAPVMMAGMPVPLLEAPAGLIDPGESPVMAARREVGEEVGLTVRDLDLVGTLWSCPGVSTERITLFVAAFTDADRTDAGGGLASENERITVVERSLADLAAAADAGELTDMKTFSLVQTLRLRRPDLFG